MSRRVFTFALLGLLALGILQAKPNFSGEWKINREKSDFGQFPPPDKFERKIVHSDPDIQVETTQATPQGEMTSTVKHTTDGKPSTNMMRGGEVKSTVIWEGDKLVITSDRKIQEVEIKSKETWSLSGDGKVLTTNSSITMPQGEFQIKLVLDKIEPKK